MEIEKKRETSWNIQLRNNKEKIRLTSVEISGEIRLIKFSLINNTNSIEIKLERDEFFNFISLLTAFKDVVIGDDSYKMKNEEFSINLENNRENEEGFEDEKILNDTEKNEDKLDPKDWDPW